MIPTISLVYIVCLRLCCCPIGYLDVNFSYIVALKCKPATAFVVWLNNQEYVSNLEENLARLDLGITGVLYKRFLSHSD